MSIVISTKAPRYSNVPAWHWAGRSSPVTRRIIGEFRAGNLDQVPVWMDKNGRTFLVTYYAVRDKNEQYLGTLELVQDMEFAKEHFR